MKRALDNVTRAMAEPRGTAQSQVDWRLEAIRHVRMMMGQGYRRIAAQHQVAEALGRTIAEIQAWERELVKSSDAENDLLCAEFAGELLEYLVSGHYTNVPHYNAYGQYSNVNNVARASEILKQIRRHSLQEIRARMRRRSRADFS